MAEKKDKSPQKKELSMEIVESFCETYEPAELGPDSIDLDRRQLRAILNAEQQFFIFNDPLPGYLNLLYNQGFKDVESPYSHGRVMPVRLRHPQPVLTLE